MICGKCRKRIKRDSLTLVEKPSVAINEESDTKVGTYRIESALQLLNESLSSFELPPINRKRMKEGTRCKMKTGKIEEVIQAHSAVQLKNLCLVKVSIVMMPHCNS